MEKSDVKNLHDSVAKLTDITMGLQESVELIAVTTVKILDRLDSVEGKVDKIEGRLDNIEGKVENIEGRLEKVEKTTMATKKDVMNLQIQMNGMENDLKSFKLETRENFGRVDDKLDDMHDTIKFFDGRFEKIEEKVFA